MIFLFEFTRPPTYRQGIYVVAGRIPKNHLPRIDLDCVPVASVLNFGTNYSANAPVRVGRQVKLGSDCVARNVKIIWNSASRLLAGYFGVTDKQQMGILRHIKPINNLLGQIIQGTVNVRL